MYGCCLWMCKNWAIQQTNSTTSSKMPLVGYKESSTAIVRENIFSACVFMVMKKHVTQCNSVAHWCVFNSCEIYQVNIHTLLGELYKRDLPTVTNIFKYQNNI